MTLLAPLREQWQQSRAQLAANPRLGWGLWAIALLGLLYANLWLSDQRALQTTRLDGLYLEWQDAASLAGNADWPARLQQAQQALAQQASRFGSAGSEALARAEVQAALGELMQSLNIAQGRVEVSAAPRPHAASGLMPLQVQITGRPKGDQLLALLHRLESGTPFYRIDSLTTTRGPRSQFISLNLLATVWYQPWESTP